MAQGEVNASLLCAAENVILKKKLDQSKSILADVSVNLKSMVGYNIELLAENIELKKKLIAANTVICEHVAEKATLENLAAENAGLAEECNALQKQLTAIKETLRKYIAFSAHKQYQVGVGVGVGVAVCLLLGRITAFFWHPNITIERMWYLAITVEGDT